MATFLVLIPPGAAARDEKARFLRDRFSWIALLLPVLWLLWHRAFVAALLALAVQGLGLSVAGHAALGAAGAALVVATGVVVALEGPSMVAAGLEYRGWTLDAAIVAEDRATAEDIYYWETAGTQERVEPDLPASDAGRRHGPMLGLVGFGEGR